MLVSLGLDFRRARLEVRERFLLEDDDLPRIHDALASRGADELVLTRTCNRVEAYCWWPEPEAGWGSRDPAVEICQAWVKEDPAEARLLRENAHVREAHAAVRHLLRVASGLESQILGDMHILGQLRRAFQDAAGARSVGTHLHRLFETALRVGKRVKRETRLMATRNGVGSEAARKAGRFWGELAGLRCVVIGCGKSGTHAARSLRERGAGKLTLVNRTRQRAERLANDLGSAGAVGLEGLPEALRNAHVVVVATGAPEPVLSAELLARARGPEGARLLVIDVSVPRNAETAVGEQAGVSLVDLDALHPEAAQVEKSRAAAVPEAEALVEEGVDDYLGWLEL